jgi:hypothetical protein
MNHIFNKMFLIFALALTSGIANAAATHDYDCIAQTLQTYNPNLYSNLTPAKIDEIMNGVTDRQRGLVITVAMHCDQAAQEVCASGNLEAKFLGHVENLNYSQDSEAGNMPHTTFGVGQFVSYSPNPFCGLDAAQAEKASFWIQGQSILKDGQEVAGTIRFDASTGSYMILGVKTN